MALAEYGNALNIDTDGSGNPILVDPDSGGTIAIYDRGSGAWQVTTIEATTGDFNSVSTNKVATGARWENVTESRSLDTTETAPSDEDVEFVLDVEVNADGTEVGLSFNIVGGAFVSKSNNINADNFDKITYGPFTVPAGQSYEIQASGDTADFAIVRWSQRVIQ